LGGIDLHLHSTASDGDTPPADLVRLARAAGLEIIALTDHDTLAGVRAARATAGREGVTVIAGCEFSVAAPWGEMHLLGYYLPEGQSDLDGFLERQRAGRAARGEEIVRRLGGLGVPVTQADVRAAAGAGAVGRPHVAKAMVERRLVRTVQEAFDRYLATGRPAYVPKALPPVAAVVELVRSVGGVTSAAHLGERADPRSLEQLKRVGLDAVEVVHPAHNAQDRRRIERNARQMGLLPTGGSDWHGDSRTDRDRGGLGVDTVPMEWAEGIRAVHEARAASTEVAG
jgi:predicted metal-dependent phosphoesterase TrpH